MSTGVFRLSLPSNEPVRAYLPKTAERFSLQAELHKQSSEIIDIPCVINGEHIFTGKTSDIVMPFEHRCVIARVHLAGPRETRLAVEGVEKARKNWSNMSFEHRAALFLRAAELLAGPWRNRVNASTMLGQAKTAHQAEIDSACELIDFWRFNAYYASKIIEEQPPVSPTGIWNRLDYRPLDGFVLAITPFNFTSIAANLPTAPALFGNTAIWKPAISSSLSCWYLFQLLEEAGLPPGVIQLLHGHGAEVVSPLLAEPTLGGVHFTGSTGVFQSIWQQVGTNLSKYQQYPRLVGETGGKDFIIAHPSANPEAVATAIVRGGYEYQGQKCSAASRIYLPTSLWPTIREHVVESLKQVRMGDVRDFQNFVSAVIDERAFQKHSSYLELAKNEGKILAGGDADNRVGYFVEPTLVQVTDPHHRLMKEEIFGPIVTVFVYDDTDWIKTLHLLDKTSSYALTGAVFANDRTAIAEAEQLLRFSAGNFYINDKPTGAVVGQQPFGGGRASGTNDKAGSALNLLRWVNPRTIKETFVPPNDWRYPFLASE